MAHMEEMRSACRILIGNPEGNGPLLISRCRWEDNIEMDLWDIG
jgi:hypothetical protein